MNGPEFVLDGHKPETITSQVIRIEDKENAEFVPPLSGEIDRAYDNVMKGIRSSSIVQSHTRRIEDGWVFADVTILVPEA